MRAITRDIKRRCMERPNMTVPDIQGLCKRAFVWTSHPVRDASCRLWPGRRPTGHNKHGNNNVLLAAIADCVTVARTLCLTASPPAWHPGVVARAESGSGLHRHNMHATNAAACGTDTGCRMASRQHAKPRCLSNLFKAKGQRWCSTSSSAIVKKCCS